jgi:hypothetical protein
MRRGVLAAVLLCCTACVAPARSFDAYESKAAATAESAGSAVATAILTVDIAGRDGLFAPNVSVLVQEAEQDAASAQATFSSIQPPDPSSDALRAELEELLAPAVDGLAQVRIAARRGDLARMQEVADPLRDVAAELRRFAEAHG